MNNLIVFDAKICGQTERLAITTSPADSEMVQVVLLKAGAKIVKLANLDELVKRRVAQC